MVAVQPIYFIDPNKFVGFQGPLWWRPMGEIVSFRTAVFIEKLQNYKKYHKNTKTEWFATQLNMYPWNLKDTQMK